MEVLKQKHIEVLKAGMESLKDDNALADVEITVHERKFDCHRAFLASISPYFRVMFTGGMMESRQNKIVLHDIEAVMFEKFLQFVYTGKVELLKDDVVEILRLASLFQVDCLHEHCERLLLEDVKADNSLEMFTLSCIYNCTLLKKRAWPAILDGFFKVSQTEEFYNLTLQEVIAIIREENLVTFNEEQVSEAVLKWINADLDNRKQHASRLLYHVRMPHLSPEYLVNTLQKISYLMEDTQCRKLIDEAVKFHLLPARQLDYSGPRMKYRADDDLEEVLLVLSDNIYERGLLNEGGSSLWAFSFHQNRWFTLTPLEESPGFHFALCSYGYDIYLSGGLLHPNKLIKFDSHTNEWITSPGSMKKSRSHHSMIAVGNHLFCLGGTNMATLLKSKNKEDGKMTTTSSVEEYNIAAQTWTLTGDLVHPIHSAPVAVVGEQILVIGGLDDSFMAENNVQCFHSRLKQCSIVSNFPYFSRELICTTIGDKIFVSSIGEITDEYDERNTAKTLLLGPDFGFSDSGFDIKTSNKILGITHHDQEFVVLTAKAECNTLLDSLVKVNPKTAKQEGIKTNGKSTPKVFRGSHRCYIDKKYLYHTYFQ